uniref:Peptidase S1 domain-containing protein n=1 Tax=Anabas testudineus TaxID=64144 RepID=A0A3Q1J093_ANATE
MKFVILALFVAGAYGCGRPTYPPTITGGVDKEEARKHSGPWQVSVQFFQSTDRYVHACAGALISNQWVLTAARCVSFRLSIGKHNLYDNEAVPLSSRLKRASNNIALIKLLNVFLSSEGLTSTLQQGPTPVVDNFICTRPDWMGSLADKNMVCAGGYGTTAGCAADGGSPLNCQNPDGSWTVHGVAVTGSVGCNIPKKPIAFSRVSSYIFWINHVITTH